jgi:N-acetylmuramoyl-L-alanine amidase
MASVLPRAMRPGRRPRRSLGIVLLATVISGLVVAGVVLAGQSARPVRPAVAVLPATTLSGGQPVLRLGSRGSAVVYLQHRLAALHYDVGAID